MHSYHILLKLYPSTSSTVAYHIPKTLLESLPPTQSTKSSRKASISGWQKQPQRSSKHKDYRYGPIRIDWADIKPQMEGAESSKTRGKDQLATTKRAATTPSAAFTEQGVLTIFGTTSLPEGTVHIFRDTGLQTPPPLEPSTSSSPPKPRLEGHQPALPDIHADGTLLAVLAVPSYMTPPDFLTFIGPAVQSIIHLRMIRDSAPHRSMVLIKFKTAAEAKDFAEEYNGRHFNSLEPEICHVVHVISISIETPDLDIDISFTRQQVAQGSMFEMPTCPVCLERMDAAITGLVTVPCSHTFHCMCLSKWGDSRCPVCRYSQTLMSSHPSNASRSVPFSGPPPTRLSLCFDCSSSTNLWICLICGNVGCGRYGRAHAHAHYQLTTHLYALELETQRVWDYAGDAYVHRLIQNKADGKLVELPSASSMTAVGGPVTDNSRALGPGPADTLAAEKVEAIGIEYSYLLTSQLDSQRAFYEEQTMELKAKLEEAQAQLESVVQHTRDERQQLGAVAEERQKEEELRREAAQKERAKIEKKAEKAADLARKLEKELKEERAVSEGLLNNLNSARLRMELADKEREELKEQVRDLMFFLEAKDTIEAGGGVSGEAAGGSVELPTQPPSTVPPRKKKKGKR